MEPPKPLLNIKTVPQRGATPELGIPQEALYEINSNVNQVMVPVMVNTYFPPAPSAKRCVAFGQALAEAIRRTPQKSKVAVIASGGLSHTIIDEALDHGILNAIKANDVDELRSIVLRLWDNQINTARTIGDVSRLASVLRG